MSEGQPFSGVKWVNWCGARSADGKGMTSIAPCATVVEGEICQAEIGTVQTEKGKTMVEWAKVIALTIFVCVFIIHEVREAAEQDMEEVRELNRMLLRFKSNAETAPVVHAHLINPDPYGECSNCGCIIDIRQEHNYCPNCGAKMD